MSDLMELYSGLGPVMDRDRAVLSGTQVYERDLHWSEELVLGDLGVRATNGRRVTVRLAGEGCRLRTFTRCNLAFVDLDAGAVLPKPIPAGPMLLASDGTKHYAFRLPA